MTDDFIEAGSNSAAIGGERVAYVPCFDAAFPVDADDDSEAIDGNDEGRVALGTGAGDFADSDDGQAVYGSTVGFVAGPCGSDVPCFDSLPPDYTVYEPWWRYDSPGAGAWDNSSSGWGGFDLVATEQGSIPPDPPGTNYVVFFKSYEVPAGATGVALSFDLNLGVPVGDYAFPLASSWAIHLANWGAGPPTVFSDPQTLPPSTIIASSDTVDPADLFPVVDVTIGISGPLQLFMTGTAYEGAAVWLGAGPDPGTFPDVYREMRVNVQTPVETEWIYGTPCGTCTEYEFTGDGPQWITVDAFGRTIANTSLGPSADSTSTTVWGTPDGPLPASDYTTTYHFGTLGPTGDVGVTGGSGYILLGPPAVGALGHFINEWRLPGPPATQYFEQDEPKFEVEVELVDTYSGTTNRHQYIQLGQAFTLVNVPDHTVAAIAPEDLTEGLWFYGPKDVFGLRVGAHLAPGTYLFRFEGEKDTTDEARLYIDGVLTYTTTTFVSPFTVRNLALFEVATQGTAASGSFGMRVNYWRAMVPGTYDPLIDVGPYTAGTLSVAVDGDDVPLDSGTPYYYEETDPVAGTISVYGLTNGQTVTVCRT